MNVTPFRARQTGPCLDQEGFLRAAERACERAAQDGAAILGVGSDQLGLLGGKRIRSRLTYECVRALGGDAERAVCVAAAVEMIHGASLCHDDVIDDASVRRGRPTLNQRFGNHESILLGDYLFSSAWLMVGDQPAVANLLAEAIVAMSRAELVQARSLWSADPEVETCLSVMRGKTAALFSACAGATALALEAARETVTAFQAFGLAFGMAFQMIDDVLDYDAGVAALGKEPLKDLRSGLSTLPLAHALARDNGPIRQAIDEHFRSKGASGLDAERVAALVRASGALEETRQRARQILTEGCAALAGHVPTSRLSAFAHASLERTR